MKRTLILSPGEKLKQLRKNFKFTQNEIAGTSITRNLISLIESNKAALTPQVAAIVTNNINVLCKSKGISFTISEDYLLESVEMQVKSESQKYINYLSDSDLTLSAEFQDKVNNIETFLAKYDLADIKLEIYYLIAELYIKHNEFSYAYKYYIKAYENSGKLSADNTKQIDLLFSLAFCCGNLNKYRESLDYYEILETCFDKLSKDMKYKLKTCLVITYKKLNQFDICLNLIDYLENQFNLNSNQQFTILNTKANCYMHKKEYSIALNLQKQLLSLIDTTNLEPKLVVLCNMMEIYIILHDTISLKRLVIKCSQYLSAYGCLETKIHSQNIYNYIAISFFEIKDYVKAEGLFLKAIEESRLYKNTQALTESFENLIEVYATLNDRSKMNDLKNKLLEFISLELIPKNSMLILKFIQYYNYVGDSENVQNILNFVL